MVVQVYLQQKFSDKLPYHNTEGVILNDGEVLNFAVVLFNAEF